MPTARLFVCFIALTAVISAQSPVIPIVQGSYLLGGTQSGKWLPSAKVAPTLRETTEFVRLDLLAPQKARAIGKKGEEWGACPDAQIIDFGGDDDAERDETKRLSIGASANWNVMPRRPVLIASSDPAYVKVVKDLLRTKRITRSPVKITQILEIDLDGDGKKETLVSASYYRRQYDLSRGDYSFTLLRATLGKAKKNILIDGQFLSNAIDFDLARHSVVGVADLNNDGKMEIGLSVVYSEGDAQTVFEFKNGKVTKVLEEECGA